MPWQRFQKEACKSGALEPAERCLVRFSPDFMKIPLPAVTSMELGDLEASSSPVTSWACAP